MAEGKRYYWLKLHKDFFRSKRIKKLRSLAGGDTYTIIYLKMQLLSLEDDGVLTWTGVEDTFAKELALDIDESPDDVTIVVAYLVSVGLLEKLSETEYLLPFVRECTGSETDWAQRKRIQRGQSMDNVPRVSTDCPLEIEIEKEKDIELEKDNKGSKRTRFTPPTVEEVRAYCKERGNDVNPETFVDYYSARGWALGKGQKMKDWKAAIRYWERNEYGKPKAMPKESYTERKEREWAEMEREWNELYK